MLWLSLTSFEEGASSCVFCACFSNALATHAGYDVVGLLQGQQDPIIQKLILARITRPS